MDETQTQATQDTGDIKVTDTDIVQEVIREGTITEESGDSGNGLGTGS